MKIRRKFLKILDTAKLFSFHRAIFASSRDQNPDCSQIWLEKYDFLKKNVQQNASLGTKFWKFIKNSRNPYSQRTGLFSEQPISKKKVRKEKKILKPSLATKLWKFVKKSSKSRDSKRSLLPNMIWEISSYEK